MNEEKIIPWELLQKKITWRQLDFIKNKRILDFGSGNGMTADHFAIDNIVTAIEPNELMLKDKFSEHNYKQIVGSIERLGDFDNKSFDVVLCHNVLEYVEKREELFKEFSRILKKGGYLSVLKHNRAGRVMQMVVLLNNFEHANQLLDGEPGHSQQFGDINYYQDTDILKWSGDFVIDKILGIRTFWHLQQNQSIQKEKTWQENMIDIELKVSSIDEYRSVACLHHVILIKK